LSGDSPQHLHCSSPFLSAIDIHHLRYQIHDVDDHALTTCGLDHQTPSANPYSFFHKTIQQSEGHKLFFFIDSCDWIIRYIGTNYQKNQPIKKQFDPIGFVFKDKTYNIIS